jgi:hypothetical protein
LRSGWFMSPVISINIQLKLPQSLESQSALLRGNYTVCGKNCRINWGVISDERKRF